MEFSIKIIDNNKIVAAEAHGRQEVSLFAEREYQKGDHIRIECSEYNCHVWLQLDDALGKSMVYLTGSVEYEIPFGEKRSNLSPKVFGGKKHLLCIRKAHEYEVNGYRNLALNVNDQHGISRNSLIPDTSDTSELKLSEINCYPHASANVETRGESVFAARNAIDGVTANCSHGNWPYASWGINRRDDAEMRIDFGRMVKIDRIILYTRADFPHDNWWTEVTFSFSDGSEIVFPMEKSRLPHELTFEKKQVEWVSIGTLIKADDPSPFPALTQMEVYGWEL